MGAYTDSEIIKAMLAHGLVGEREIGEAKAAYGLTNDKAGRLKAYFIAMHQWESQIKGMLPGYVSDEQFLRCVALVGAEDASPLPELPETE